MGNKNKYKSGSIFDMQFITSSISTTLVLLLLGLVVFFVLTAHNLSVYVRENISFSILISDDMKEADILKLQKKLNQEPFVKQSEYISKKQALKEQTEAMGTDPEEFLGYNPFTASIEIKLHSDYANSDSIAKIEKMVKRNSNIQDVLYRKELIDAVNENIRNISLVLLALAVVLVFRYLGLREAGEQAAFDTGIHDLHPELVRTLGRLRYRTSYGQNVLQHSIEVSHIAGMMAAELGADVQAAKRAGLLHDIGKAVDHEMEGTHVALGVEFLRKYHEKDDIIHAVQAHHNDVEPQTIVACLVQAADAISAARPGARRENLENYIKRLEQLEEITGSYPGVDKAYAIQAGREVRVMVKPDQVSEDQMVILARELAKKIEEEMEYPGQIKVHVLRETTAIEYAK